MAYSEGIDAFGRLRVSIPQLLFNSTLQYDTQELLWESSGDGTVTHQPDTSSALLSCNPGETICHQTRRYLRYTPGKSLLVFMTGTLGAIVPGAVKRIGYFDDENGIFVELSSAGLAWVRRSNSTGEVIDTKIFSSDWSVQRPIIDPEKVQIFTIDLQWLGSGSVRCGFLIAGKIIPVQVFDHANLASIPYMTTANLPARYDLDASASNQAAELTQTCTAIFSEGGDDLDLGEPRSASNQQTPVEVSTSPTHVLSICPSLEFKGQPNRVLIIPESVEVLATTNDLYFQVVYNTQVTGGAGFASIAESAMSKQVDGIASGGILIYEAYVPSGATGQSREVATHNLLGTLPLTINLAADEAICVSIIAYTETGISEVKAVFRWREVY